MMDWDLMETKAEEDAASLSEVAAAVDVARAELSSMTSKYLRDKASTAIGLCVDELRSIVNEAHTTALSDLYT